MITSSINELLGKCIVKIFVSESQEGYGFFVAPNRLLTCFHVISIGSMSDDIAKDIKIQYGDQRFPAQVVGHKAKLDLALLSVELVDHPTLPLNDDVFSFEILHVPGHTDPTVKGFAEKIAAKEEKIVLEAGGEDIQKGVSGTPLFHPRTRGVCGFISGATGKTKEFKAVHIQTALKIFPELANQRDNIQHPSANTTKVCFIYNNDEVSKAMLYELMQLLRNLHLTNLAQSLHWEDFDRPEWWEVDSEPWPESQQISSLTAFDTAHIILLLVSANFHGTNAYYKNYIHRAREQYKSGNARVIQVLSPNASPVPDWPQETITFGEFTRGIREVIEAHNSRHY